MEQLLGRYGLPPRLVQRWRERQGEHLLPIQEAAVRAGLLQNPPVSLLLTAPTSAGKSFCAEMAALGAVSRRQKALLVVPLKALAEERYQRLQQSYQDLGVRVIISTGDRHDSDHLVARGEFDIAVLIYEKLDRLLTQQLDLLGQIGLIAIDELQMLAEPGRGAILERLLVKLRSAAYCPALLALSAVIGESSAKELCAWLGTTWVHDHRRPADLWRGIAGGGTVHFRSASDGRERQAVCPLDLDRNDGTSESEAVVDFLAGVDVPTLVFLKSRQDTVNCARQLAARITWPSSPLALAALANEEPSALLQTLRQTVRRGVAFHNADLTLTQRQGIEQAFRQGEIRVLCTTTTLAMGVNLPADLVLLEAQKYQTPRYGGRPVLGPISRVEFDNMTGRAGRFGVGQRAGEAMILARTELEREILWQHYLAPADALSLPSAWQSLSPDDWLLDLIVSGVVTSPARLAAVSRQSFGWSDEAGRTAMQGAVPRLIAHELMTSGIDPLSQTEQWLPTMRGRAMATGGLRLASALRYETALTAHHPGTTVGWLALLIAEPLLPLPPTPLTAAEYRDRRWPRALLNAEEFGDAARPLISRDRLHGQLEYDLVVRLKLLFALHDWITLTPVQELERRYRWPLGQFLHLGEHLAHTAAALLGLQQAVDSCAPADSILTDLSFSLRTGLPPSVRELVTRLPILTRYDCQRLHAAGITTIDHLAGLSPEARGRFFAHTPERLALIESGLAIATTTFHPTPAEESAMPARTRTRLSPPTTASASRPSLAAGLHRLVIDGRPDGERFLIHVDDQPVPLTGKSFKYLTKLAWARQQKDGWIFKDDLEIGFNQARYLYRMKQELSDALGSDWEVVENNRLGSYRLAIEPVGVQFQTETLALHPDWEVRQLFVNQPSAALGAPVSFRSQPTLGPQPTVGPQPAAGQPNGTVSMPYSRI